jgi:hypothetical protein
MSVLNPIPDAAHRSRVPAIVFLTGFDRASRQITVYQRTEGQMSDLVDKITGKTKQAVGDVVKANEVANLERETH